MPIGPWELLLIFVLIILFPAFVAGNAIVKRTDLETGPRIINGLRLGCAAAIIGIVVFVAIALLLSWLLT